MSDEHVHLSIVIPVYNSWNNCADILNRILDLKNDWVEIILVNDASVEKPMQSAFTDKLFNHKKVQIINLKTNGGVSRARNIGFKASRGKFLWFFDSDDQIGKDFILALDSFRKCREKNIDLFILNYLVIDNNGGEYTRNVILDSGDERVNYLHEYIFASNFSYNQFIPVIWRYIIRRDFLLSNCVFFNDARVFEDNTYLCRLMIKRPKAFVLQGETYKHIRNPHSLSSYLDPSDVSSFYSDVVTSSLSILHDLNYEFAHHKNYNIISYLVSQLRKNISFLIFSFPFLEITSLQERQWRDLISSLKKCRADIFDDYSLIIEDSLLATYNSFKKFITNTVCHISETSSVGIYCISTFSIGCAKLLIEMGFNVKCFFDRQFSSDIGIDDMKFPVKNFRDNSEKDLNLDYIIIINRRRDVCHEILDDINRKNLKTTGLVTIHIE